MEGVVACFRPDLARVLQRPTSRQSAASTTRHSTPSEYMCKSAFRCFHDDNPCNNDEPTTGKSQFQLLLPTQHPFFESSRPGFAVVAYSKKEHVLCEAQG